MHIEPIGAVLIGLGILSLWQKPIFAFYILLCAMLFGAAAALQLPGVGSVQPGHLMLGFALLSVGCNPALRRASNAAFRTFSPGFWLVCACVYGVASAIFLPRLFAGQVNIVALSTSEYGEYVFGIPLKPTNGNITQSIYFVGDVMCFYLFYGLASFEDSREALTRGFLVYGILNTLFAATDIILSSLGVSWLLNFMRNSNYLIYADSSIGGVARIIGSFSEASAFAYATLGIAMFSVRLWLGGVYSKSSFCLACASLVLLVMSTSSTAFVAMTPCFLLIGVGVVVRVGSNKATSQDALVLSIAPLVAMALVLLVLVVDPLRNVIDQYLNEIIWTKSLSASGIDRARMNREALNVFWQTGMMGAGLGSIRTSSFVLAVLGNLGLLGAGLFAAFLTAMFLRKQPGPLALEHGRAAASFGCFGLLCAATTSGSLTDLGLPFFALAAYAVAPNAAPRLYTQSDSSQGCSSSGVNAQPVAFQLGTDRKDYLLPNLASRGL